VRPCYMPTLALIVVLAGVPSAGAERLELSRDWRFHHGALNDGQATNLDDHAWRSVSVPHDWAIMDRADGSPPFNRSAVGGQDSGYLPGGIGWYRREITLDAKAVGKIARLTFEAVYMDADVWVNGLHLTRHHYGYTAFTLDLTGKLRPGRNVIAVRVNHEDPSSRWYAGSGIIRPVHLDLLDPIHLDRERLFVTTPVATAVRGEVSMATPINNRSAQATMVELVSTIIDVRGRHVTSTTSRQMLAAGGSVICGQRLSVERPSLWSTHRPNLYQLHQVVRVAGITVDEHKTRFGIRSITADARRGLLLNGVPIELRGGNIHHDNYMLGAAGWPDADRRKVAVMKAAGYNAIRSAHNPASQATLDAADELGMLVIDEAFDMWNQPKRDRDYSRFFKTDWRGDVDSLILSGRNHPSVLFWSIGNEIPEQGTPEGVATARMLVGRIRELDPTRPTTQAVNIDGPGNARQFAEMDVAGYNYRAHLFGKDHAAYPDRIMYTSESVSKDAFGYWRAVETMPWVVGDFVWTAVDYIGESGIGWMGYSQDWKQLGPYPWHLAYSGEIDVLGYKRPAAYYREIVWKTGAPVAAFVHQPAGTSDLPDRSMFKPSPPLDWSLEDVHPSWSWPGQEGKPLQVDVYASLPEVELRLNGRSLGRKPVGVSTAYKARYTVPYRAGTLTAIGYSGGRAVHEWTLKTAGRPARVQLTLDRKQLHANGKDLAYLTIEVVDAQGVPVYAQADDIDVTFKVAGAGTMIGVGSGNPQRVASFRSAKVTTFHGRAIAVIQSGMEKGEITVSAKAQGIPAERASIQSVIG